ncbi:hypothetical protein BDR07DRAFT_1398446 [Suillus spraguei]|nr:hypothetical protein BDR07DRAFT_1398446 [Suillus spraguei]
MQILLLQARVRKKSSRLPGQRGREKVGNKLTRSSSAILHTNPPWISQLPVTILSKTMILLKRRRKLLRRRKHYQNAPPLQNRNRNLRKRAKGKRFSQTVTMRMTTTPIDRGHLSKAVICPRLKTLEKTAPRRTLKSSQPLRQPRYSIFILFNILPHILPRSFPHKA